jgi:hypothetical protein
MPSALTPTPSPVLFGQYSTGGPATDASAKILRMYCAHWWPGRPAKPQRQLGAAFMATAGKEKKVKKTKKEIQEELEKQARSRPCTAAPACTAAL